MRTFLDVLNSLDPAHPEPMMEPRAISGQIQEVLGAKPSTEDDPIKAILSQRFQPNLADIGQAGSALLSTGQFTPAQSFADKRMEDYMTRMTALARAQSLASGGSGSVFAQTMDAIEQDPELSKLSMMDKIRLAQNKLGTNLTMDANGMVNTMANAPQALGQLAYGEKVGGETGTQQVKQVYEPATAGMVETSKNNADIAAAGPLATQKATGEAQGTAVKGLPQTEQNVAYSAKLLSDLVNHPGLDSSTGLSSYMPIIRGTDRADFESKRNQINGIAFLQAFSSLRGSGSISDAEGQAATRAVTRLGDPKISKPEFIKAANELYTILQNGLANQKAMSQGNFQGNENFNETALPAPTLSPRNPGMNLPGANTPLKTPSGINYRIVE